MLGVNIEVSFPSPACTHLTSALRLMALEIILVQSFLGQLSLTPTINATGATLPVYTSDVSGLGLIALSEYKAFSF